MEAEGFRLISALQGNEARFKGKINAAYFILLPALQGVLNIRMMLSLRVNSNCISKS